MDEDIPIGVKLTSGLLGLSGALIVIGELSRFFGNSILTHFAPSGLLPASILAKMFNTSPSVVIYSITIISLIIGGFLLFTSYKLFKLEETGRKLALLTFVPTLLLSVLTMLLSVLRLISDPQETFVEFLGATDSLIVNMAINWLIVHYLVHKKDLFK